MEARKRHIFVWNLLLPVATFLWRILYNFHAEKVEVKGPFLLFSNHVTDLDPVMAACSFKEQIYFVASEHLMRSPFWGKLVTWLQAPIPRQKGGSAADTVMTTLRHIKKGYNVGIFPEGNRCWDGVTASFPAATAKMTRTAAASGASLVTYRLEGGYFASPRWSGFSIRRGRMTGRVVGIYGPEELRAMKPAEIEAILKRDLYEDAYATQRETPIAFKGRKLAEGMETLFFLCPKCGRLHTLVSAGDTVSCSVCDFSVRYLPTGFIEGAQWDNLRDWNLWQQGEIRRMCDEAGEEAIFTDTEMECFRVESGHDSSLVGQGSMALYKDRLELPGVTLPLSDIRGISLRGPQDIYFGTLENNYQLRCKSRRCTVRYLTAISYLNNTEYGV